MTPPTSLDSVREPNSPTASDPADQSGQTPGACSGPLPPDGGHSPARPSASAFSQFVQPGAGDLTTSAAADRAVEGVTATYSPEDNKLRLYSVSRLDRGTYERVSAAGFSWAPRQELFVAPAWTPEREDLLVELCGEIGDEDTSLVERAEERAGRFGEYRESRASEAEASCAGVDRIAQGIPLGQPILVGHHSERRARKDAERIEAGMRRAIRAWETSEYWRRRAAGAIRSAKYKERPDVRHRRIKRLETDLRRERKQVKQSEDFSTMWARDGLTLARAAAIANYDHVSVQRDGETFGYSLYSLLSRGAISAAEAATVATEHHRVVVARSCRWIKHIENRLAYERTMLGEDGGLPADRFAIEVGGRVLIRGFRGDEWVTVMRVTRKAGRILSVRTNSQGVSLRSVEEIRDYRPPAEGSREAVIVARKLPPLTNYPQPGALELPRAEWDRTHRDFKGTLVANATGEHGAHRYRTRIKGGALVPVFITDAKRIDPPAAEVALVAAPIVPAAQPDLSSVVAAARARAERAAAAPDGERFEVMRERLEQGVTVVSAPQLFPTPGCLADRMAELAELSSGQRVLEPSAGTGALVGAIRARCHDLVVTAVEISSGLVKGLRAAGEDARHGDFLDCQDLGKFNRIVMNPPFDHGADIKHILHAKGMLAPGGKLIGLCAAGPRQETVLLPMVEACGGIWEEVSAGTFVGTSVRAVLFTLLAVT
jgi:hypothetical protein